MIFIEFKCNHYCRKVSVRVLCGVVLAPPTSTFWGFSLVVSSLSVVCCQRFEILEITTLQIGVKEHLTGFSDRGDGFFNCLLFIESSSKQGCLFCRCL